MAAVAIERMHDSKSMNVPIINVVVINKKNNSLLNKVVYLQSDIFCANKPTHAAPRTLKKNK